MAKYRIIGNMTGNSMDAIDLVLTEFDGDKMRDICAYSKPYTKDMQYKIETLRAKVYNKTRAQIEELAEFLPIHNEYVQQIAECVDEMCFRNGIDKHTIDAIGFHGKTLDHNPPSKARIDGSESYTLQIGSGQMLADLTGIPIVYDFRSDYIMEDCDGAPLVAPHNAHIALVEGDGCYYNGGNTSNFALIKDGTATLSADAGPFNEYTDGYIRLHTAEPFDRDAMFGKKGKLNTSLLQTLFDFGRNYYEMPLPKSGDPAYYSKDAIFKYIQAQNIDFTDAIHTFEYFAAYIAVQALTLVPENMSIPSEFVLFGGGWKNPLVRKSFEDLLHGNDYVLPKHQASFHKLRERFTKKTTVRQSEFGDFMEARLFADLARYKLEDKVWEVPEVVAASKKIVCGQIAYPQTKRVMYNDCINRAAKGWLKR